MDELPLLVERTFGMKSMVSMTHVLMNRVSADGPLVIVSKGLLANHYLDASLGLTLLFRRAPVSPAIDWSTSTVRAPTRWAVLRRNNTGDCRKPAARWNRQPSSRSEEPARSRAGERPRGRQVGQLPQCGWQPNRASISPAGGTLGPNRPLKPSPERPSSDSVGTSRMLALGVWLALGTIAALGTYTFLQVRKLRDEQTAISERNRKGSLQLLRIQNDLASVGVLMRDMAEGWSRIRCRDGGPPSTAAPRSGRGDGPNRRWRPRLGSPHSRRGCCNRSTRSGPTWTACSRQSGTDEPAARQMIRGTARGAASRDRRPDFAVPGRQQSGPGGSGPRQPGHLRSSRTRNPASRRRAPAGHGARRRVVRLESTRVQEVADVSEQLRTLSWRTLRVQEDVQRSISRELHDDFGQIVTAIGTLLGRARRQIGPASPLA